MVSMYLASEHGDSGSPGTVLCIIRVCKQSSIVHEPLLELLQQVLFSLVLHDSIRYDACVVQQGSIVLVKRNLEEVPRRLV